MRVSHDIPVVIQLLDGHEKVIKYRFHEMVDRQLLVVEIRRRGESPQYGVGLVHCSRAAPKSARLRFR
jgi:hypothetical protein